MATTRITPSQQFRIEMEKLSGQKISRCYQCGKCTAGCPAAHHMDLGPRRIMRGIQLGLKDDVLSSSTIWLCLACQTCSARCPLEIDIARVLEALRHKAVAERRVPGDKNVAVFHKLFLQGIRRWGHIYELGLGGAFNLRTGQPLLNAEVLPLMLLKRKLPVVPRLSHGRGQIKAIFDRIKTLESNSTRPEK